MVSVIYRIPISDRSGCLLIFFQCCHCLQPFALFFEVGFALSFQLMYERCGHVQAAAAEEWVAAVVAGKLPTLN